MQGPAEPSRHPEHVCIDGACNALGEELEDVSDHKPLWGLYHTANPAAAQHTRMARPPPCPRLPRTESRVIAVFQERMLETLYQLPLPANSMESAEADIECMTQYTVQLAKEVVREFKPCSRRTSAHKNGYSAEFMLRKRDLCIVIALKRHMYGLQGKVKWTSHRQIMRGIRYMYTTLRARASSIGLKIASTMRILESSGGGEAFWTSFPAGVDGDLCDRQIDTLWRALHGRKRLETRKAATCYTSWVEQMREQGQTGKVIKAVLGVHAGRKHQDGLSMDTLRFRTGEVTGDPVMVHTEITDVFRERFFWKNGVT